ncbi:YecA family protein [Aminipila sp.]|uniref:YecA family protein n=1 Tax=Aminipila sp. TaxID=2060095 RepID=UPI00289B5021|nr:SEC-C domain-containing protein [Aminipila sp.]
MPKKIQRNAICPLCDSGLKYKNCCGKNEPIKGNSMRFISSDKTNPSDFEKKVREKLGYYPDDYIKPIKSLGEVIYVLIDESNIGDCYSVGGIVVLESEIEKNKDVYGELQNLVEKYQIDTIHFTEIFGHKKILGDKRREFLKEYADIVNKINLVPFTVCKRKDEIENLLNLKSISTEQCYMALTWLMMFNILIYLITQYGPELIIEMWRENDNVTVDKRILHQQNIAGIIEKFPFANISIYKDYIVFSKRELLFSSLTDFIAYLAVGLYPKINSNYQLKQLANNYYDLIIGFNDIFKDTIGMRSKEFDELISIVKKQEYHRLLKK